MVNNPKKSLNLFQHGEKLDFFIKLHQSDKLPRVLMLTGEKGIGKFTLINHFMCYVFDKENYDLKNKKIDENSKFYQNYLNGIFFNILYLSGENYKKTKIEHIRDLKSEIFKSSAHNKERFIILDDIELFNSNSLNALLKLIEEPKNKDYFVLINNKTKSLVETISSRALEIKIFLNNKLKNDVIKSLIEKNKIKTFINFNEFDLSPGNFLSFNQICYDHEIDIRENFLENFKKLIKLYKKDKDLKMIKFILFLTDVYFLNLSSKKYHLEKVIEDKNFIIDNINNFINYNLNQTTLLNSINNRMTHE